MRSVRKILSCWFILILCFPGFASDKDTLAVVGNKIIYKDDFIRQYKEKMNKIGFSDSYEIRKKYLDNLINDALLIAEAKNRGFDKTANAEKEFQRIRIQELLNAYSLAHISTGINVTEEDLKDLFVKLNTRIKVSHLYADTKEKAELLYSELQQGKSFKELAKENFSDPVLRNNGGSLGYITIDEMDPDFEKAAYSLKPGEISKPVKTVQGYSIIMVEDIVSNPLLTDNEFLKVYDRLKAFARKRAFEESSKELAQSLSKQLNTYFNKDGLDVLFSIFINHKLASLPESSTIFLSSDLAKTVVKSDIGKWDVKAALDEIEMLSPKQKKFIRTEENLEDVLSGLINRKYILSKAKEERLDHTDLYNENLEFLSGTYLLTQIEEEIKKGINIPADSLAAYYKNNTELFTSGPEIRLSSILLNDVSIADSIYSMLNSGSLFEELARKYSIQSATAVKGGDMGFFKKEDLGELANKVFPLKPGAWTGPFSDNGNHVFLKCTAYKEAELRTFEDSKKEIEGTLSALEFYNQRERYTEALKTKIPVKVFTEKLIIKNPLTKIE